MHQYLHSTSCHPRHCKSSIAYSQTLKLRRICSIDWLFASFTGTQEAPCSRAVHQTIKKVKSIPRLSVLSEKPTTRDCANKNIPVVVTYHPFLSPTRQMISANQHILHTSDRSPRSLWLLSDTLLAWGTSLSELRSRPNSDSSIHPIQHGICGAFLEVLPVRNISWSQTQESVHWCPPQERGHITCTTSNIIYLIYCRTCDGIQYIGET